MGAAQRRRSVEGPIAGLDEPGVGYGAIGRIAAEEAVELGESGAVLVDLEDDAEALTGGPARTGRPVQRSVRGLDELGIRGCRSRTAR